MKVNKLLLSVLILSFIGVIGILPSLPHLVPLHWNIEGKIDNWGSKYWMILLGSLPLLSYGLFFLVPKFDPRRESYEKHEKAYQIFITVFSLFMVFLVWLTIGVALKYPVNVPLVVCFGMGILFFVIGNYMGQIRPNYTFGIKTPWTLASETVWKKTHRLGGILFILNGLFMMIAPFIALQFAFYGMFIFAIGSTIYLFGYSYYLYQQETKRKLEK